MTHPNTPSLPARDTFDVIPGTFRLDTSSDNKPIAEELDFVIYDRESKKAAKMNWFAHSDKQWSKKFDDAVTAGTMQIKLIAHSNPAVFGLGRQQVALHKKISLSYFPGIKQTKVVIAKGQGSTVDVTLTFDPGHVMMTFTMVADVGLKDIPLTMHGISDGSLH